jgi:hypothetical protein
LGRSGCLWGYNCLEAEIDRSLTCKFLVDSKRLSLSILAVDLGLLGRVCLLTDLLILVFVLDLVVLS